MLPSVHEGWVSTKNPVEYISGFDPSVSVHHVTVGALNVYLIWDEIYTLYRFNTISIFEFVTCTALHVQRFKYNYSRRLHRCVI